MTKIRTRIRANLGKTHNEKVPRVYLKTKQMKVKVSFVLCNNNNVETFSWDATGSLEDKAELATAMNNQIQWMQGKALAMKQNGQRIGKISATNLVQFKASVYNDYWEDLGLEEVHARLGKIRLCTRNKDGWQAANHLSHVELVVESVARILEA